MSPHLTAKLLKPVSPLLHPDDVNDFDDMVYSPYSRLPQHQRSTSSSKQRRSHQLSAEVRAEVVARVLDPAYSGRRERDYTPRVFVDNRGDEHDPDYQLFPTQPTYSRHRRSQSNGFFRRVPSDDELMREEEDAESEAEWTRSRAASPYTPSPPATPSPRMNPMSLFDDEWDEKEWTREVVVPTPQAKRRKHKAQSRQVYIPVPEPIIAPSTTIFDEPEEISFVTARQSSVQLVREDTIDTTMDDTPSCGYVLRRQWATFTLHTRLSAHRIARRARRAVSVGT